MKKFVLLIMLIISSVCHAVELAPATKKEVAYLFSYLENSGCQFNRNGTWYKPKEAVDHLDKKYQYLLGKNLISNTESFISQAATESSMSGKAYQVKCANVEPVASAVWFKSELVKYRQSLVSSQ